VAAYFDRDAERSKRGPKIHDFGNKGSAFRKECLEKLEDGIRRGMEDVGSKLIQIRDDELYEEAGFPTWDRYLTKRVGEQFGIERAQAYNLIACAQVRGKLAEISSSTLDERKGWSQRELLELARLAPVSDAHGQPRDLDNLDPDVLGRVVRKVLRHCEKEGVKHTSALVRRFVDEKLGIDRTAPSREVGGRHEEEAQPELGQLLAQDTDRLEVVKKELATPGENCWEQLRKDRPELVERFCVVCDELGDLRVAAMASREVKAPEGGEHGLHGVGMDRAKEAVECLKRIPEDDPLRKRGLQLVMDWVRHNL
jgi:hypothetical protein